MSRGCGDRLRNQPYFETELSPTGKTPIGRYINCHPRLVSDDMLRQIPNRGAMTFESGGTTHIVDRIGLSNYTCAGFVHELMVKGMSRKSTMAFDFSKINKDSRYLLVHPQAIIPNAREYYEHMYREINSLSCKINDRHADIDGLARRDIVETCYRHWMCDHDKAPEDGHYTVGDLCYRGFARSDKIARPDYSHGIIAALPITGICLIDGDQASDRLERLKSQAKIDCYIRSE